MPRISLADFAATLARSAIEPGREVRVVRGQIEFERYFATDPRAPFNWIIHPDGFSGASLLELARLQGWTLKPARLVETERRIQGRTAAPSAIRRVASN